MARDSYKNEEAAGVRIYARDKIVATTRDFDRPAGFTGEFTARSYLVGEVHAEWLDLDVGEDLIRSDRQGIIWDSDYGRAFRQWGTELIKEVAHRSRGPRREKTRDKFIEKTRVDERAKAIYSQPEIVEAAVQLAEQVGGFADEDELEDQQYINDLSDFILSVAPQRALIDAFKEFQQKIDRGEETFDDLLALFGKTRVAEIASYSRIAFDRVRSIRSLSALVNSEVDEPESKYQQLIQDAPWLIEPTWAVITQNQRLSTFKRAFAKFWKRRHNEDVSFDIASGIKRPDFVLVNVGQRLHIVEIKAGGHDFDDQDCERLINYVDAFADFFKDNPAVAGEFPAGWVIDLICDGVNLTGSRRTAYNSYVKEKIVERSTWNDFLQRAERSHRALLDVNDAYGRSRLASLDDGRKAGALGPSEVASTAGTEAALLKDKEGERPSKNAPTKRALRIQDKKKDAT